MQLLGEVMGCICGKESVLIDGVRYDLGRVVGEGGFSVVSLATTTRRQEPKAIKTLVAHSQRDLQRAKQEIQLHEKLGAHENILTLERHGTVSSTAVAYRGSGRHHTSETTTVHLVFPFYRRGTVQDELSRQEADSSLPRRCERDVLALFLDICRGVAQFHAMQPPFAHRDIKPGNVLLGEDGRGVLMDFGSAALGRPDVSSSAQCLALQEEAAEHCSMPYRPPELFTVVPGNVVDERTDIWSLGCTLYALCFLKSPFEAVHERGDSVALAVAGACIWIPDTSTYSEDVHSLILDMMALEIQNRPFIDTVVRRLEQLLKNYPVAGAKVV